MSRQHGEVLLSREGDVQSVTASIENPQAFTATAAGASAADGNAGVFMEWAAIPGYSKDSITWDSPSSFVIYRDGTWALAVARLVNGYDSYQPWDRHFSVRWFWIVDYKDAQGAVLYQTRYQAGEEGYRGDSGHIVRNGRDEGFLGWRDRISRASGWISYETFY